MAEKENKQFVTITLEEYKTLLLKQQPKDNSKVVLNTLYQCLCEHVKYAENNYYSDYIGDNMKFDDSNLESDFVTFFKALNRCAFGDLKLESSSTMTISNPNLPLSTSQVILSLPMI